LGFCYWLRHWHWQLVPVLLVSKVLPVPQVLLAPPVLPALPVLLVPLDLPVRKAQQRK